MKMVLMIAIQILVLVFISFGALIDGEIFWSCFAGLYAIPFFLMLIQFTPDLMRGDDANT